MNAYFLRILKAIDQLANTIFGGSEDELISSRLGKAWRGDYGKVVRKLTQPFRWLVNKIFFWQKDHCRESIEEDEGF